jgi:TRAP-type C4-dicarboxylate transport system permease small subunit
VPLEGGQMKKVERVVNDISRGTSTLAGAVLIFISVAIVLDVCLRLARLPIVSSYDLTEAFIVVVVAFALPYTALRRGHVMVDILVSHFPKTAEKISSAVTLILSLGFWVMVTWAAVDMLQKKWTNEFSFNLHIPYLPFRFIWVIGLCFFCAVYLLEIINIITGIRKDR